MAEEPIFATAIPPAIQARPTAIAAARYLIPAEIPAELAAASAADASCANTAVQAQAKIVKPPKLLTLRQAQGPQCHPELVSGSITCFQI